MLTRVEHSQNNNQYNIKTSEALRSLDERIEKTRDVYSKETQQLKREIISAIHDSKWKANNEADVARVSSMLGDIASRDRNMTLEQQLLHSLNYHRMRDRQQRIVETHEGTLGWIFDETGQESRPGSDLNYWLTRQHGLYWLSGKAGSGKSTLMKFLQSHKKTRQALKIWAKNEPYVIGSFYFWSPGIAMQKLQLGLLQSLMYEIIQQCSELIPTILPMRWRSYLLFGGDLHPWTLSELCEAFDLLGSQANISTRFCFFIDE